MAAKTKVNVEKAERKVDKAGDRVHEAKDRDKVFDLSHEGDIMISLGHRQIVLVIFVMVAYWMVYAMAQGQSTGAYSPDILAMQGRWVRSDAPYVIELKQDKNQVLKASYFNPQPIHVEKTETARKENRQFIMIQLQDVNYQGSVYVLYYDRELDALHGAYMHGASGQRFQVEFSRQLSQ